MGNADAWLLSEENDTVEPTSQRQRDVRAWTLSRLSPGDLDYIRSFQSTVEIGLHESQSLLCFHGSPHSYDDVLLPETREEDWLRLLGQFSPAIMAGGHTHMQQIRRIHDALFFNPGSVGVVYNHSQPKNQSHTEFHTDPCAEYSILDYDQGRISLAFRRVPYGVNELIKIIEVSGRPHTKNLINDYVRPGMERRVSPNSR
jgi:predicted phosphodiesterase